MSQIRSTSAAAEVAKLKARRAERERKGSKDSITTKEESNLSSTVTSSSGREEYGSGRKLEGKAPSRSLSGAKDAYGSVSARGFSTGGSRGSSLTAGESRGGGESGLGHGSNRLSTQRGSLEEARGHRSPKAMKEEGEAGGEALLRRKSKNSTTVGGGERLY